MTFGKVITFAFDFDLGPLCVEEKDQSPSFPASFQGNERFPMVTVSGDVSRVFVRAFHVGGKPVLYSGPGKGTAGLHLVQFAAVLSSPSFKGEEWPTIPPGVSLQLGLENRSDAGRARVSVSFAMEPARW